MSRFTLADIAKITALLVCAVLLFHANGLQATLVPVRAKADGFSTLATGWIGTAYFIGFVFGCLAIPHLLRSFGHVRSFSMLSALAAVVILVHAMRVDVVTWSLLRAIAGFAAAGMYAIIEGWLNSQAVNAIRGRVFTTYATLNALALVGGNALFALGDAGGSQMFTWIAILTMACLIPVCVTRQPEPQRPVHAQIRVWKLYRLSPAGFVGAIAVGLAGGAFWSLAMNFAEDRGLAQSGIAAFMSTVIFGGALAQWPLGRMSDFMDRRIVIMLATCGVILASLGLALAPLFGGAAMWVMFGAAFLYGASAFPIGSLANAHLNDRAHADDVSETASGILLVNGCSAAIGTFAGALMITAVGVAGLFYYTAAVHFVYLVFVVMRMTKRGPSQHDVKASAVTLPAAGLTGGTPPPAPTPRS